MIFSMFGRAINVRASIEDLLVDIGLDGKTCHQRLEHGLRVDVDARRRRIAVWNPQQHNGTDHRYRPGDR